MSEEKPTFKVTDRRLFNPDGTPREGVERAEEPQPPAPESPQPQAAADAGDEQQQQQSASGEPEAGASAAGGEAAAAEETSQEFLMLVEFVASFAADAMGMVGHPGEVGPEPNLPLARQCIDMLGALQLKTRGQLSAEELRFLEALLTQLRMQYVSLTGAPRGGGPGPAGGPRGFSGTDITGGR